MYFFNQQEYLELRQYLRKNQTEAEQILWKYLRKKQRKGHRFCRQYGLDRYIVDFYCPEKRLVIELDGDIHLEKEQNAYDTERNLWMEAQDFKVLRFQNSEVYTNLCRVLTCIENEL